MPTVVLPDGTRIDNVPEGITRQQLVDRLKASGDFDDEFLDSISVDKSADVTARLRGRASVPAVLETGLQMATGAVGETVGGLAGLLSLPFKGMDSANVVRGVSEALTYQPRTGGGRELSETVAVPFQAIERGVDWLADRGGMGNPALQTTIKTTLLGLPNLVGARGVIRRRADLDSAINEIEAKATELGIDFESAELRRQVGAAAEAETSAFLGEALPQVQARLRELRDEAKVETDRLYDDARSTYAEIDTANLRQLNTRLGVVLDGFDVGDMSIVQKRIGEIDALESGDRVVMLSELEKLRKRINQNRAPGTDRAQNAALNAMKTQLDEFMDDMLNRDLVRGDENALNAWKQAREAYQSYRQRFSDQKVVRRLIEEDATPDEMRAWIFGATKAGLNREAARVANHIGELVGRNSDEFRALRSEAVFNIVEPLIGDKPNFRMFNRRYDSFIRQNPSAVRALGIDQTNLDYIRRITEAAERTGAAPLVNFDLYQAVSQALVGHQISRRGLMVRTFTNVLKRLAGTGASERRAILSEMLGQDPTKPLIPRNGVIYASMILEEMNQDE